MTLTDKEKAEFKKEGEKYRTLEYNLDNQIVKHRVAISNLEKEKNDSIPKTPKGRLVCKRCYVRSIVYLGRTPQGGSGGGDEIYECEICGNDEVRDTFS